MSTHQRSAAKANASAQQPNLEAAMRISSAVADANGRLLKVQSEAANQAIAENSKYIKALLNTPSTGDYGAILAELANLYQANLRIAMDVGRCCFEIVPQAQAEIVKVLGESLAISSKGTQ